MHRVDELRRRAEQRHAGRVGEVEQHVAVGMERRAVVEQQRRLRRERRDQPVPHHPAAGREVEDAIAGLDVAVELVLLEVLDQRAAGAMDDALGDAGRARRVEDVERMVERQRLETRLAAAAAREARSTARRRAGRPGTATLRRTGPRPSSRRSGSRVEDLPDSRQRVVRLSAVEIAVGRDEHSGLDLPEAIDHALHAEVGRAGRPDRANRRGAERRDDRPPACSG